MGLWSKLQLSRVHTAVKMADEEAKRKEELNNSLKEYISEWRKTREKEEDELSKLKEKQAKRKEIRLEQEKKLNQQKREEEEKMKAEEAERKAKEAEEKKKRLEEAEAKRQEMLEAQKAQKADAADKKKSVAGGPGGDARKELSKTKEQLEEEKKIALSIRIKPLELEAMDSDELKAKAEELFKTIIQMETDKYDYEQRKLTQELDLKELKERQKAQLRAKALKKGLDPEALTGKYPPKIRMYSKYERRTDTRSYDDRKKRRRSTMRRRNRLFTTTDKVQVLTSSHMICLVPTFPILTGFVKTFIINMVCTVHHFIILSTVSCNGQ